MKMNKIIAIATLVAATTASAGFFNNNNNYYKGYNDNGFFAFNGFNMWDPRWYAKEFTNMVDEFDDGNYSNYGYRDYNKGYRYIPAKKSTHNFAVGAE